MNLPDGCSISDLDHAMSGFEVRCNTCDDRLDEIDVCIEGDCYDCCTCGEEDEA